MRGMRPVVWHKVPSSLAFLDESTHLHIGHAAVDVAAGHLAPSISHTYLIQSFDRGAVLGCRYFLSYCSALLLVLRAKRSEGLNPVCSRVLGVV